VIDTWLVIPCYNEERRLDTGAISELLKEAALGIICVNDGSTDRTDETLLDLSSRHPARIQVLDLPRNMGKGEAIRRGLAEVFSREARITGYLDADFATSPGEILRLLALLRSNEDIKVLLGSRWLHLGAHIERSYPRHYAGRLFATLASAILRMPIYDTQCGAKLFRVTDNLRAAIEAPFLSRWSFDVELIGRLREGVGRAQGYELDEFLEAPLDRWTSMGGSKIGVLDMVRATLELIPIGSALKRLRR
jgi:glycosyltransferase involved in cell wall biosynthesis